ncbi:Recombinase, partial [human gut metagenome]
KNEKYMGDVLLQKTYTPNLFEGKHKKNNGEVTQYYIKNHHPAIVSREMFQLAQEELARRNSKKPVHTEKRQRRTADGSPANTPYQKDWFAETAAAITGESPGIFMEGNRWSGGVLIG